jgi:hypothetical protein
MRSPSSTTVAWWRGSALVALVAGLLPVLGAGEAAATGGAACDVTTAVDEPGDRARVGGAPGAYPDRLTLTWPRHLGWAASADPFVAAQPDCNDMEVKILHPRANSKVLPRFVAAIQVAEKKGKYKKKDVTPKLVDADGKEPAGSKLRVLKIVGNKSAKSSRVFVFVKVPTPGKNPHKLTVEVNLPAGKKCNAQSFDIVAFMDARKQQPQAQKAAERLNLFYPMTGHTVSGDERDYFVPCGESDASINAALLGGAIGIPHWDNSDEDDPIWWAEFTGLATIPGPGTYKLVVTNTDGESLPDTDITIDTK